MAKKKRQTVYHCRKDDLLPSLQISMVYPSRPDEPTTSGWLQMILTEVSFLSSTNRSRGALVGSVRKAEQTGRWVEIKQWSFRSEAGRSHGGKKTQVVRPQSLLGSLLNGGLPLGGGGGGVGGLGSSGAAASGASPDIKQALLSGLWLCVRQRVCWWVHLPGSLINIYSNFVRVVVSGIREQRTCFKNCRWVYHRQGRWGQQRQQRPQQLERRQLLFSVRY